MDKDRGADRLAYVHLHRATPESLRLGNARRMVVGNRRLAGLPAAEGTAGTKRIEAHGFVSASAQEIKWLI